MTKQLPAPLRMYCALSRLLHSNRHRSTPSSKSAPRLTVYSDRSDGLGARLIAATWGKIIADYYNADFKVSWSIRADNNIHHATETAEEIFSEEFVRTHIIPPKSINPNHSISLQEFLLKYFPCELEGRTDSLIVRAGRPERYKRWVWLALGRDAFSRSFHSFDFSDQIKGALDLSRRAHIPPDAIAIHLRSGDIINGPFRKMDRFSGKVIPYKLACAYMAEQRARGQQIIVFGQDETLGRAIAQAYQGLWAPDLMPEELTGKSERAFFDVGLMTRCSKIVSGSSEFTQLAAAIQGNRLSNLKGHWPYSKIIEILTTAADPDVDAAASNLQKAFSYGIAARLIIQNDPKDCVRSIEYLDAASKLDPENLFYTFIKAAVLYSTGQTARADALIAAIHASNERDGLIFLLTGQSAPVQRYMPLLLKKANANSAWASLCLTFDRSASAAIRAKHASKALGIASLNPELRDAVESIRQSRTFA